MAKFKIRLESQTDDQFREVTTTAETRSEAIARATRNERRLVAFSLLPKPPVKPESPHKDAPIEDWDEFERLLAVYENDVESFPGRLAKAEEELAELDSEIAVNSRGRIVAGPKGRRRAHWHAHHQELQYEVVGCKEVHPDVDRLVSEIKALQQDEAAWKATLKRLGDEGIPLAAVTGFMYGVPVKNQYDGTAVVDWDTNTIKVALLTAHTENQDTHDFFDDVVANEITGTGYTAGGATLTSAAITYDSASDQIRMDAADTSWTTSTLSSTECVVYKSTGVNSTSPLIAYMDFGATVTTTAGTFQITWDATGIVIIDVT